jgi:hypothetical protein
MIADAQSPGARSISSTSMPWRDLNQIRSVSTKLMIEIGTPKRRAAREVIRSNAPSGGVSNMS